MITCKVFGFSKGNNSLPEISHLFYDYKVNSISHAIKEIQQHWIITPEWDKYSIIYISDNYSDNAVFISKTE